MTEHECVTGFNGRCTCPMPKYQPPSSPAAVISFGAAGLLATIALIVFVIVTSW